jgi:sugar-specific transcriptional regulator TrmB
MYSLVKLLRLIGLSEKEALTYLVCLKIGTNPTSIISRHAELNRCTVYSVLEKLQRKKLIHEFEKNKIRYFTAAEPDELVSYIDSERYNLKNYRDLFVSNIPKFNSLKNPYHITPEVQTFRSERGIQKIYHKITNKSSLSVICVCSNKTNNNFLRALKSYMKQNASVRILRRKNMKTQKFLLTETYDLKKLPPSIPVEVISTNHIYLLSASDPFGVEIKNSTIVQQHREHFNILWNL